VLDHPHAFWLRAPAYGEVRPVALPEPGRANVRGCVLRSGVSRGTETRVMADRLAERARDLDGLVVTLREFHIAWATYERPL
jgi:hypothetical protein